MMRKVGAVGVEWAATSATAGVGSSSASASASASSTDNEPVLGTRVRFNMEEPTTGAPIESHQPATKKQKMSTDGEEVRASASAKDDAQDLMDDLEDDDEEEGEGEKEGGKNHGDNGSSSRGMPHTSATESIGGIASTSSSGTASVSQSMVPLSELPRGPWISSDDVDFGDHDQRNDRHDEDEEDIDGDGGGMNGNDEEEEGNGDDDDEEEES